MKHISEKEKRKCEINERLEELDRVEFMVNMSDMFTVNEREQLNKVKREQAALQAELREIDKQ